MKNQEDQPGYQRVISTFLQLRIKNSFRALYTDNLLIVFKVQKTTDQPIDRLSFVISAQVDLPRH